MHSLPAALQNTVILPSDMLKEALCRGMACTLREGRTALDKMRWLESRYAAALWSRLKGAQAPAGPEESLCIIAVELVGVYTATGMAEAMENALHRDFSSEDLLRLLAENVASAAGVSA